MFFSWNMTFDSNDLCSYTVVWQRSKTPTAHFLSLAQSLFKETSCCFFLLPQIIYVNAAATTTAHWDSEDCCRLWVFIPRSCDGVAHAATPVLQLPNHRHRHTRIPLLHTRAPLRSSTGLSNGDRVAFKKPEQSDGGGCLELGKKTAACFCGPSTCTGQLNGEVMCA